jgi:hypothetical protein
MIIYHRREREPPQQSYADWKADRAQAMNERSPMRKSIDTVFQNANRDPNYYFGLGQRIQARQEAAGIPIAGEGAVQFLGGFGDVARWGSKVWPPMRPIYLMVRTAEEIVRLRAGMPSGFVEGADR